VDSRHPAPGEAGCPDHPPPRVGHAGGTESDLFRFFDLGVTLRRFSRWREVTLSGQHRGTRAKHVFTPPAGRWWAVSGTAGLIVVAAAGMVGGRGLLTGEPPAVTVRPSAAPTAPSPVDDGSSGDAVPAASPTPSTVSPGPETLAWSPRDPPFADGRTDFVPLAVTASAPASTAGPAAGDRVTAHYTVASTWDSGFIVRITVQNPTATAASWRVVVAYPKATTVIVTRAWGATVTGPGHRLSIKGGPLAPGTSTSFRLQADKDQPGPLHPDTCTVNGTACTGV
jgi:hypothetical protein